jgi:hypothetical protein
MPKIPKTITIDEELLDWIEQKINDESLHRYLMPLKRLYTN